MVTRWHFVNTLPLIFDVLSIGAILIMHHMNFRAKRKENQHPYYTESVYDLQPEDVENLEYMRSSDEYFGSEQEYLPRKSSSTLNSDPYEEQEHISSKKST